MSVFPNALPRFSERISTGAEKTGDRPSHPDTEPGSRTAGSGRPWARSHAAATVAEPPRTYENGPDPENTPRSSFRSARNPIAPDRLSCQARFRPPLPLSKRKPVWTCGPAWRDPARNNV
ncbi:hypothetical protein GCM10027444_39480 [Actinopolyspora lacussalsi]